MNRSLESIKCDDCPKKPMDRLEPCKKCPFDLKNIYEVKVSKLKNEVKAMSNIITIVGYDHDSNCEHCGRKLKHGIKVEQNGLIRTVGAMCLSNDMTLPQEYQGKKYRLPVDEIINKAKWLESKNWEWLVKWRGFTYSQIQFQAA
jgi:hypothetical protein